jgi:arylsulfatase
MYCRLLCPSPSINQASILFNGDTHGRRDYVFIYAGPELGATVKQDYKRHWISSDPGAKSGIGAATYFLPLDTREKVPMLVNLLHTSEAFLRMRARHELWIKKYPNKPRAHAIAYQGIANASPEVNKIAIPKVEFNSLPFNPTEYIDFTIDWPKPDPDVGQ